MISKVNIRTICKNSTELWHRVRWSSTGGSVVCPYCGETHIYNLSDGRYKCRKCRKRFSDRTGTILQNSKVSVTIWLIAIFKFAACKECSAIDLMNECGVNYKTAYSILQKLRFLVGKDKVVLEGILKIDEAYIGAEWKNVHLRKKMTYMKKNGYLDIHNRYTKRSLLQAVSAKKSHILSIIDVNNKTRLIHCPNPITKDTIRYIIKTTNATGIISDESKLYTGLDIPVYQSNHSGHTFTTKEGYTSNACENRFSWTKRKLDGVYSSVSEKYLQLYLWQRQWQVNHSGDVDDKFYALCKLATKHRVRTIDIRTFDYKKKFPKSRRTIEEEQAKELLKSCSIISSVTDKYGRVYK